MTTTEGWKTLPIYLIEKRYWKGTTETIGFENKKTSVPVCKNSIFCAQTTKMGSLKLKEIKSGLTDFD